MINNSEKALSTVPPTPTLTHVEVSLEVLRRMHGMWEE
jgi:hypothetical protein